MSVTDEVRAALREASDEAVYESAKRFFKEHINCYGIKSAVVGKIAKKAFAALKKTHSKDDIFALCDDLWRSGYLEEGGVACEWIYALREQYVPEDFARFEYWVGECVGNWASCDTLCNHSFAALVTRYPECIPALVDWTGSENRWKRRAAAVTFIIPARKGLFLDHVFAIAGRLLEDGDDMVQKGYGWMLKAASEAHPAEVFDFLMQRKMIMPRTAFRYALEKMPPEWRTETMQSSKKVSK